MQKWQKEMEGMAEYVKHCSVPRIRALNPENGKPVAATFGGVITIRVTGEQSARRYTVAAVVDHENGLIALATAIAHPVDTYKFSKKIGHAIALGRARKIMAENRPLVLADENVRKGMAYNSVHGFFELNGDTTPADVQEFVNHNLVGAEAWAAFILKRHAELAAG